MLNYNEAAPGGETVFIRKPYNDFLLVVFWHASHISHHFRVIRRKSIWSLQTRPLTKKSLIRKPDPDFLLVFCWRVLPTSYRFRVTRINSIRPLQRHPGEENNFLRKPDPDFVLVFCWHFASITNHFRVSDEFLLAIYTSHVTELLDDVRDRNGVTSRFIDYGFLFVFDICSEYTVYGSQVRPICVFWEVSRA
jgi:hypothetical protein